MQAIRAMSPGGPEVLQLVEVEHPRPTADQVLIRTRFASINFADLLERRGQYSSGKAFPFTPGLDVVGTVVSAGAAVSDLQPGQRVLAFPTGGSYAELVVAGRDLTFPLPDTVTDLQAAAPVACGAALGVLTFAGRLDAGETVLVHSAAGGVGTILVQLARLLGSSRVIASVGSEAKKDYILDLGVDAVLNYRTDDYPARVLELTEGRGADLITNSIAGDLATRDLDCLADFGRLVLCGKGCGEAASFSSDRLHKQNRAVVGFSFGHIRKTRPKLAGDIVKRCLELLATDQLQVTIGAIVPLSAAADAHRLLESRTSTGKILLQM